MTADPGWSPGSHSRDSRRREKSLVPSPGVAGLRTPGELFMGADTILESSLMLPQSLIAENTVA